MYSSKVEQWFSSTTRTSARSASALSNIFVVYLITLFTILTGNLLHAKLRECFISIFRRNVEFEAVSGDEDRSINRKLRTMPDVAPSFFVDTVSDSFHFSENCSFISRTRCPLAMNPCMTCLRTNSIYYWSEQQLFLTPTGKRYHHHQCVHVAAKGDDSHRSVQRTSCSA